MKTTKYDVAGFGICPCDYICYVGKYPSADEKTIAKTFVKIHGGPVPNAICALSQWGNKTAIIGRVGNDSDGEFLIDEYRRLGVETRYITNDAASTAKAFVWVCPEKSTRAVVLDRTGSKPLNKQDIVPARLPEAKIFHTDARDPMVCIKAMKHYRKSGTAVVVDAGSARPNIERLINLIDHFVASLNFIDQFFGPRYSIQKSISAIREMGAKNVVVTLGDKGCVGLTEDGTKFEIQAHRGKVKIYDTTGAGDIFHGGYIHGLLQGWDVEKCARFGNAAAYLKCAHPGGSAAPLKKILSLM